MESVIQEKLKSHIRQASFPCVMAKAVEKTGRITLVEIRDLLAPDSVKVFYDGMSRFIDSFRSDPKLSSFIVTCDSDHYSDFSQFEEDFWIFLNRLRKFDHEMNSPDPRVSDDPLDNEFSFSIKSEAFFILLLHPESPRWARRFPRPPIVFNAHVQFEKLRTQGVFDKVRTLIRKRDKLLQGTANPMLSDYGERSEIFQYTGRNYGPEETVPLMQ